jgi:hypothetical protein
LLFYSHIISARLQYIVDFIGKEILHASFQVITDKELFKQSADFKINYSTERISADEYFIQPHSLLFEKDIKQQSVDCFESNGQKAFFKADNDFPFDIFAASFYILSRYEEYLPHQKDMYGRFAHENSIAYKENFLHLPLINIWIQNFKQSLAQKFPSLKFPTSNLKLLLTYDIDEAFAYKYKSRLITTGGIVKAIIKNKWGKINERKDVLAGKIKDPYDA